MRFSCSSSRFLFRVQASRQADVTERPTHAGGYAKWVLIKRAMFCFIIHVPLRKQKVGVKNF